MQTLSRKFILLQAVLLGLMLGLWGYGLALSSEREERRSQMQQTAGRLLLTDLCLSTESRHTRNLAMPELLAPFQDFPGGPEHFPSSSFLWPADSVFWVE